MVTFAANLSMMFNEVPFLDRFARAAAAGFEAVEFLFPYEFEARDIKQRLEDNGLALALFNLPPGDWTAGERGFCALPGREQAFAHALDKALDYADVLGCERLHCMAGIPGDDVPNEACERAMIANLQTAAPLASRRGVTLLLEPINTRDIPGYALNYQGQARAIIEEVGSGAVRLQLDLYHCQIMEGDLATHLRDFLPITGHVQVAGVPERHEPDTGEINYPYLFGLLDELGYQGFVGCEYRPRGRTEDGLGWFVPFKRQSVSTA